MSPTLALAPYLSTLRIRLDSCVPVTNELALAGELVDFLIVLDQTGRLTYALVLEAIDSLDGVPELDHEVKALKQAVLARQGAPGPSSFPGRQRST